MEPGKTNLQENQNTRLPAVPPRGLSTPWAGAYPASNEIDLVDLGVMLWRRWRLMLAVFLVLVVLAILAAIFKSPTYDYTTTVKLGTVVSSGGNVIPLVAPASVVQALQSTYIPNAIYQYDTDNHADIAALKVEASTASSGDSTTVALTCKAKVSKAQVCIAVEKMAAEAFIAANSQTTTAAQNALASLQTQATVLQINADKLKTSSVLYQQQAADLQKHIAAVRKADIDSAKGVSKPADALSNLLLSTQVQQSVDQLSTIQQTLDVTIPGQQAALAQQIADNQRAQQLQQQMIAQNTNHVLSASLRSLKPVGLGRSAIVALGIVIGIFLAIFAALLANYAQQVRARLDYANSTGK